MIELCIEPGRTVTWEEFKLESTARDVGSIGLDGYVKGQPRFERVVNEAGHCIGVQNFNHHEEVNRLATLATCQQVDIALKSGFVDGFREEHGRFMANVYVNDSDQDVCAAVWLLRNKHLVHDQGSPVINRFVTVAGLMDMTAGSYPFDQDTPFLETLNWINQPYNQARLNGEATSNDPEVHRMIIDAVGSRIDKYIVGRDEKVPLDTRYTPLEKGKGWMMIREVGPQGKLGAINDGADALIQVRDNDPEHMHVSFWRKSEWIPIDFHHIMERLNEAELARLKELQLIDHDVDSLDATRAWGGGNTTFGSPRVIGTRLDLSEIAEIADEFSNI